MFLTIPFHFGCALCSLRGKGWPSTRHLNEAAQLIYRIKSQSIKFGWQQSMKHSVSKLVHCTAVEWRESMLQYFFHFTQKDEIKGDLWKKTSFWYGRSLYLSCFSHQLAVSFWSIWSNIDLILTMAVWYYVIYYSLKVARYNTSLFSIWQSDTDSLLSWGKWSHRSAEQIRYSPFQVSFIELQTTI